MPTGTGGLTTRVLRTSRDATEAIDLLDRAEASAGVPLVDESERQRLLHAAHDDASEHHHAVIACLTQRCVGYGGLIVPPAGQHGVGDVAVAPDIGDTQPVLQALLHAIDHVAQSHRAHGTEIWKRVATTGDVATAIASGYAVHRRLYVLGRRLDEVPDASATTRAMRPDDIDAVVEVLAAAYQDSHEQGWTRQDFETRTTYEWFDYDDIRIAEVDGRVVGLHWTKRRDASTGEVYNLAVHPEAQGQRLGSRLLLDGLRHLATIGCRDALLWVDPVNESALRLYVAQGFRARWEDVALRRHTHDLASHAHLDGAAH